jgi:hypothetical protein
VRSAVIAVLLWATAASAQPLAYRHAYYLFLADTPTGCEACYVPLLLTPVPLDALGTEGSDVVVITTYERDSIWASEKAVRVRAADVVAAERKLRLRTKLYRYQEAPPREVVRLLEHPRGTIPIARPMTPALPPAELAQLLADFRALSSRR